MSLPNKQNIPPLVQKRIQYDLTNTKVKRYIVQRFDKKLVEVSQQEFDIYKNNNYFKKVIINWYIKGTREFVRNQNIESLNRAEQQFKGIKNLIVNPLQLYQGDSTQQNTR
jgi:hypothetical protein